MANITLNYTFNYGASCSSSGFDSSTQYFATSDLTTLEAIAGYLNGNFTVPAGQVYVTIEAQGPRGHIGVDTYTPSGNVDFGDGAWVSAGALLVELGVQMGECLLKVDLDPIGTSGQSVTLAANYCETYDFLSTSLYSKYNWTNYTTLECNDGTGTAPHGNHYEPNAGAYQVSMHFHVDTHQPSGGGGPTRPSVVIDLYLQLNLTVPECHGCGCTDSSGGGGGGGGTGGGGGGGGPGTGGPGGPVSGPGGPIPPPVGGNTPKVTAIAIDSPRGWLHTANLNRVVTYDLTNIGGGAIITGPTITSIAYITQMRTDPRSGILFLNGIVGGTPSTFKQFSSNDGGATQSQQIGSIVAHSNLIELCSAEGLLLRFYETGSPYNVYLQTSSDNGTTWGSPVACMYKGTQLQAVLYDVRYEARGGGYLELNCVTTSNTLILKSKDQGVTWSTDLTL